jgi:predicted nucleic acid-binding protein
MKIFWDTNLFIYLWEKKSFQSEMKRLTDFIEKGDHVLMTSLLTVGEILVHPLKMGRPDLQIHYLNAFQKVEVISFDLNCARHFSVLRSNYSTLRAPDAIQLSCAAISSCDLFLTNDDRLSKIRIPEIKKIQALQDWQ